MVDFVFNGGDGGGFGDGEFISASDAQDHVALGLARLPYQFRDSSVLITYLELLLESLQSREDVIVEIIRQKGIEAAIGVQLDIVGEHAGIPRPIGLSDLNYRKLISLKILANNSHGSHADVAEVLKLAVGTDNIEIVPEYPAGFLFIPDITPPDNSIMDIVAAALPITVKMATSAPYSASPRFCFAGGTGIGFSDVDAPDGSGGQLRSRKEYS